MKTKRVYITMAFTFVGTTGIDIPVSLLEGKSEEEQYEIAYEYAKDHLDEIPVASDAEYVENSDEFDIDDIEFDDEEEDENE